MFENAYMHKVLLEAEANPLDYDWSIGWSQTYEEHKNAQKNKFKRWGYHVLIAIDQLCNALTGGAADETFSSRCYRGAVLADKPKARWRFWYSFVNSLFFDKNHCKTAYESELKRRQYPEDFQLS